MIHAYIKQECAAFKIGIERNFNVPLFTSNTNCKYRYYETTHETEANINEVKSKAINSALPECNDDGEEEWEEEGGSRNGEA